MFSKELKLMMMKNRINRLSADPTTNLRIIRKLQRQIRNLER